MAPPSFSDSVSDSFSFGESTARRLSVFPTGSDSFDFSDTISAGFKNEVFDNLLIVDESQTSLSIIEGGWSSITVSPKTWTVISTS